MYYHFDNGKSILACTPSISNSSRPKATWGNLSAASPTLLPPSSTSPSLEGWPSGFRVDPKGAGNEALFHWRLVDLVRVLRSIGRAAALEPTRQWRPCNGSGGGGFGGSSSGGLGGSGEELGVDAVSTLASG